MDWECSLSIVSVILIETVCLCEESEVNCTNHEIGSLKCLNSPSITQNQWTWGPSGRSSCPLSPLPYWVFSFHSRYHSFVQGSCCLFWDWTLNTRWPTEIENYFFVGVFSLKGAWLILMAQTVKNLPILQDTRVLSLGGRDHLAEEMATHSSIRAWRIKWIVETVRLQPMGLQRFRHKWMTHTFSLKSLDLFVTYNKFYWYWTVLILCVCVIQRAN